VRAESATQDSGPGVRTAAEVAARVALADKLQRWDIDGQLGLMRTAARGAFVEYQDVLEVVSERNARIEWLKAELARLEDQVAQLRKMYEYADESALRLRLLDGWHEDFNVGLFWAAPVDVPPFVGTPNDTDWPFDDTQTVVWIPCPNPVTDGSEFLSSTVAGGSS
jgi:uncharacterized small protein (DUF1192 family)